MINYSSYPQTVLAGKALLTIKNPATGNHVKIKMRQCKDKKTQKPLPIYFMQLALLGDKNPGFIYTGTYFADTKRFKPAADLNIGSRILGISTFLLDAVAKPEMLKKTEIEHAGKCCRCGRTLTHPDSIKTGIGPECSKHI